MADRLEEKTRRYERLLDRALSEATVAPVETERQAELAEGHMEMAAAYLTDGRHFQEEGDFVNALAAYSYGHGWLDAAIRAGFVDAEPPDEPGGV